MEHKEIKPLLFESQTEAYYFEKLYEEKFYQGVSTANAQDLCILAMGLRGVSYIDRDGAKVELIPQDLEGFNDVIQTVQKDVANAGKFQRGAVYAKPLFTKEAAKEAVEAAGREKKSLKGPLKSVKEYYVQEGTPPQRFSDAWKSTVKLVGLEVSNQEILSSSPSVKTEETPEKKAWREAVEDMRTWGDLSNESTSSEEVATRKESQLNTTADSNVFKASSIPSVPSVVFFKWEELKAFNQAYTDARTKLSDPAKLTSQDLCVLAMAARGIDYFPDKGEKKPPGWDKDQEAGIMLEQNPEGFDWAVSKLMNHGSIQENSPSEALKEHWENNQKDLNLRVSDHQNQKWTEEKKQGKSDIAQNVVQIIVGVGIIIGALIVGIALSPVGWIVGGLMGAAGATMLFDGLRDDRAHDRAESNVESDWPDSYPDLSERPEVAPRAPSVPPPVSLEVSSSVRAGQEDSERPSIKSP